MMRKLKNKIKTWVVTEIFKVYFGTFLYPFDKADLAFKRMPAHQKAKYLKDINNWVKSDAYRLESQEVLRRFYQDLALKPIDDVTACGYRLAIMMEQDKQKRLLQLNDQFNEMVTVED